MEGLDLMSAAWRLEYETKTSDQHENIEVYLQSMVLRRV